MFFHGIGVIIIILTGAWCLWKFIITPFLEHNGIEVDEEEEVKTDHTKRLAKTKDEYVKKTASVNAIREEADLTDAIRGMEDEINRTEDEIKDK